jgi:GNAT superfamily N-acetyltransferase
MIEKNLGDYFIFEIDKNPVACVALHVYPEQKKGELACLYVNPSHENQGIGRKLIQFVENKAREMGLANSSRSRRRRSRIFNPKAASPKARPTICRPRAAKNTSRAEEIPRCS